MKSPVPCVALVQLAAFAAFGCYDDKTAPAPQPYKIGDVYQQNGVTVVVYEVSDDRLLV